MLLGIRFCGVVTKRAINLGGRKRLHRRDIRSGARNGTTMNNVETLLDLEFFPVESLRGFLNSALPYYHRLWPDRRRPCVLPRTSRICNVTLRASIANLDKGKRADRYCSIRLGRVDHFTSDRAKTPPSSHDVTTIYLPAGRNTQPGAPRRQIRGHQWRRLPYRIDSI